MHLKTALLLSSFSLGLAFPTELEVSDSSSLLERAIGSACTTPDGSGTCQKTTSCTTSGFSVKNYCPDDPTNVECCVKKTCSTSSGSGICLNTANTCSGKYVAGACPGPSNIECCVSSSTPPPPSGSDLPSLDLSSAQSSSFWTCAAGKGIKKVIPRGYSQACGSGGAVDKNMAASYKAAKAAGITNFDAYLFPCTGSQPTGVACKSISTQISEFLAAVDDNSIPVKHLWLDIEPEDASDPGVECNAWQLGSAGNEALAKQWVAAIKATGRKWGIYANRGQWTSMFASLDTDIGSDLPLWAVQDDFKAGVSTVTKFFGGWTKAYAKQYHLATKTDLPLCSASVDLDSFSA